MLNKETDICFSKKNSKERIYSIKIFVVGIKSLLEKNKSLEMVLQITIGIL